MDALREAQKRTTEMLSKHELALNHKPSHSPKRSREHHTPVPSPKDSGSEDDLPVDTRADLTELDRFISEPFEDGGMDAES